MDRMKKAVILLICVVFLLPVFASCSQEPQIVGRWETEQYMDEFSGNAIVVFNFDPEGKVYIESANTEAPYSIPFGTYKLENKHLYIESELGVNEYSYEITGEKLILKDGTGAIIEMISAG